MGLHEGHRSKLREEFLAGGLDAFPEHKVLELLLIYAIPQIDVNPIAHALIKQFGSLSGVLDAPPEELMRVEGVGKSTAALIKLIPQMARRYMISKASFIDIIDTTETAGALLMPRFAGEKDEVAYLICMDAKRKLINCVPVGRGGIGSAAVSVRRVVEKALQQGASAVILGHNHVSGVALASKEDVEVTAKLKAALELVDIVLIDHIIIGGDDFTSMRADGMLGKKEDR